MGVYSGQRIETSTGIAQARVGLIVIDSEGSILALSARHSLEAEPEPCIRDPASGAVVGARAALPHMTIEGVGARSFSDCIGAFRVTTHTDLQGLPASLGATTPCDREDLLGLRVVATLPDDRRIAGRVSGAGGAVRFTSPFTGEESLLSGPIVLELDEEGRIGVGDAGLLFTDEFGAAVGLMISSSGRRAYVAHLGRFMQDHDLRLADDWSRLAAVDAEKALAAGAEIVAGQLDSAAKAGVTMREALEAQGSPIDDPAGVRVPAKLLELLG